MGAKDMTFAQRSLINPMSSSSALNLIASHGQYFAGQLSSMDHNFLENDSPEEELEEDKLEPEEDENADDTGDCMPPLLQGHRVTLEDYFPSPTRILHEIQMQVLEKQRLKQKSKDIETGKILLIDQVEAITFGEKKVCWFLAHIKNKLINSLTF